MAKASLRSMSIDQLLKLRDDVNKLLDRRAKELDHQLARLGSARTPVRGSALRGRKVPVKFRDRSGNTWAGRGAMPVWLKEKIKVGAKLQDFAVRKKAASRKGRKPRRDRRRTKR
jgi:DNA-binding protein H-NS